MARIVFILESGTKIEAELLADTLTIGRHPENAVSLPSGSVSSYHAVIKRRGEDFYVQDLGTTNGTKLNGVEVEEGKLSDRDQLSFGDMPATFYMDSASEASRRATAPVPPPVSLPPPAVASALPPSPAPAVAGRRPAVASRQPAAYKKEGGGCAAFFVLIFFVIVAIVVGLCVRHYKETGSMNLPMDVYKKYQLQKVKAAEDKAAEKPASTDKPAAAPAPADPAKTPPSDDKSATSKGSTPAGDGAMGGK